MRMCALVLSAGGLGRVLGVPRRIVVDLLTDLVLALEADDLASAPDLIAIVAAAHDSAHHGRSRSIPLVHYRTLLVVPCSIVPLRWTCDKVPFLCTMGEWKGNGR